VVLVANALWYSIKVVLRSNGYEVHWFYGHFGDVPKMVRLIRATSDGALRAQYVALLTALLAASAIFVVLAIRMFVAIGAV
jgi:hypothetical protein